MKLYSKLNDEYLEIVQYILKNDEFKKRIDYNHHENRSVYTHSLLVSFNSYKVAKLLKLDYNMIFIMMIGKKHIRKVLKYAWFVHTC